MNRISDVFTKGPAFISYLTAGDGGMDYCERSLLALVEGGVDILEIGVPFSDPVADGPVIQRAMERALNAHTKLDDVLALIKRIRSKSEVPIVLFSYYNPILHASAHDFYAQAKDSGVDGILIVDLPLEHASQHESDCKRVGIDPIFLIAPVTSFERIKLISQHAQGFLYYVCRKGTTGVRTELPPDIVDQLTQIKSIAKVPVVAGFGISDREAAQTVLEHADGFVVGSLFVKAVEQKVSPAELTNLAKILDPRRT